MNDCDDGDTEEENLTKFCVLLRNEHRVAKRKWQKNDEKLVFARMNTSPHLDVRRPRSNAIQEKLREINFFVIRRLHISTVDVIIKQQAQNSTTGFCVMRPRHGSLSRHIIVAIHTLHSIVCVSFLICPHFIFGNWINGAKSTSQNRHWHSLNWMAVAGSRVAVSCGHRKHAVSLMMPNLFMH